MAKQWADHYGAGTDSDAIHVSIDEDEALTDPGSESGNSSFYVPCVPRGVRAEDASKSYAIVTEASVIGDGRISGTALRQAVTDFAYQVIKHTYKLAECQNPRTLPEELPRYEDN